MLRSSEMSFPKTTRSTHVLTLNLYEKLFRLIVQVSVEAGAVKAYYSWRVQNPSEALHDDMVAVEAGKGSRSVHVDWSEDAERNARSVTITDDRSKQTDTAGGLEATLYESWDHVT